MILESMTTCGKKTLNILPAITKALSSAEQDLHNLAHNVTSPFTVAQLFVGMYRMYMVARACHALHYVFLLCCLLSWRNFAESHSFIQSRYTGIQYFLS